MLHNQMTAPTWNLQPGDILVREQIHRQYGANPQAGISRSSSTPNVLVYSDHDKAGANGYDFNGWDAAKQFFYYTARGRGRNPWPRRHIAVREAKPSLPSI
jgi:Tfp pilus assembly protein PilX